MAKHIHIYFPPKRTRDQAPGSVPPSKFMPLVEALHQIIAERQAAQDADFDESKVKRDEGGKFSAQQHSAKASEHEAAAAKSEKGTPAHQAHTEAAQAHTLAAQHITTGTGWAQHHSAKAMQASQKASAAAGPANLEQLKATASNPEASVEERAAAVQQLDKMEKAANTVAASPHALPLSPQAVKFNEIMSRAKPFHTGNSPEMERMLATARSNIAGAKQSHAESALGPKPTTATSKGIKNQTHELLSSGHPFSLEELMKATGVQKPDMMRAYLADLKNPKYAAKAGALTIVKRPDGQYHVEKQVMSTVGEKSSKSDAVNSAPKIGATPPKPKGPLSGPSSERDPGEKPLAGFSPKGNYKEIDKEDEDAAQTKHDDNKKRPVRPMVQPELKPQRAPHPNLAAPGAAHRGDPNLRIAPYKPGSAPNAYAGPNARKPPPITTPYDPSKTPVDPKSAANAYKGTHAGPLHIGSAPVKAPTDMEVQAALEKKNPSASLPSTHPEDQGEGKGLDPPGLPTAGFNPLADEKAAKAGAATEEALHAQINKIHRDMPGNTAKHIAARMKLIGPINKQLAAMKAKNPDSIEGYLADSAVAQGGDVLHRGQLVGKVNPIKYQGFKTVNGAPSMTTKQGFKAVYKGGEIVGGFHETKSGAHEQLIRHHFQASQKK